MDIGTAHKIETGRCHLGNPGIYVLDQATHPTPYVSDESSNASILADSRLWY